MSLLDLAGAIPAWMERAACAQTPHPDAWFPPTGENNLNATAHVRAACKNACPVRNECLAYAIENEIDHGIWGGLTERERRELDAPPVTYSTELCNLDGCEARLPHAPRGGGRRKFCTRKHAEKANNSRRYWVDGVQMRSRP